MSVTKVEKVVEKRYEEGAESRLPELCCPIDYDPRSLQVIPDEVVERDCGCGDPSRHLRTQDLQLDLDLLEHALRWHGLSE